MTEPESVEPEADAVTLSGDKILATHLPHTFIVGDYTITPEGCLVPADDLDTVFAAAQAARIDVYEMGGA